MSFVAPVPIVPEEKGSSVNLKLPKKPTKGGLGMCTAAVGLLSGGPRAGTQTCVRRVLLHTEQEQAISNMHNPKYCCLLCFLLPTPRGAL
jgi:hypothetical protein